MLTRLRVGGFKNLDSVDLRFGPFTCVAGPNGAGKSNLFDAIHFLSRLAQESLAEAVQSVRGAERGDPRTLFERAGHRTCDRMSFLVELLIPEAGEDELGQPARASMTFLRYELELAYREDETVRSGGRLEIVREEMVHINRSEAKEHLWFRHSKAWRDSVVKGRRTAAYISTEGSGPEAVIALHADTSGGQGGGRPRKVPAASLPRTMLSSVNNAAEHRTLVLARQEMMGWTRLQLEPSALRAPDAFTAPRTIDPNGAHVPATLHRLAQAADRESPGADLDVFARVANRLSELVEGVRRIGVDVDEKRQVFSIVVTDLDGTDHFASALSDGTLRFLALTVMEADPLGRRLVCLEEPENGMHPSRIQAVVRLLEDLAVDSRIATDDENPLRQVIINTHSPSVVGCIRDEDLLLAQPHRVLIGGSEEAKLTMSGLSGTWRARGGRVVSRGELMAYLDPLALVDVESSSLAGSGPQPKRVYQREDLQLELALSEGGSVH